MSEQPDDKTPTGFLPPRTRTDAGVAPVRATTPSGARRVAPNESRPLLSPRKEAKLAAAHALSAEGYDALEAVGDRAKALADAITDGEVQAELVIDDSSVINIVTRKVPP